MNKKTEEIFVEAYIKKSKRERLLFELWGKKRLDAVGRFCHCVDDLLVESTIMMSGKYITQELQNKIMSVSDDKCYVISYYDDLDGKELKKNDVLNQIIGRGMPSIVIFSDFVIIESEQVQGPAIKYFLQK